MRHRKTHLQICDALEAMAEFWHRENRPVAAGTCREAARRLRQMVKSKHAARDRRRALAGETKREGKEGEGE